MVRFIVLLLSSSTPAAGQPAPSPRWTVDFADDHCRASRSIAVSGKPATFSILPPLDGGRTRITVSSIIAGRNAFEPVGTIDFGDGLPPFKSPLTPAMFDDKFGSLVDLPPDQAMRLRGARKLTIKTGGVTRVEFDFDKPEALARTLDRCVADLRRRVGLDGAVSPWAQPARPRARLAPIFSSTKYWTVENRDSRTNQATVRLLIDRSGRVRECSVIAGTGSPGLDVQTCQVFEHKIAYTPAIDGKGIPVASVVTETIKWRR